MMAKSAAQRLIKYMVIHKKVTFQSMGRAIGVHADVLYDVVNSKPVKAKVEARIIAWLKEHKRDDPKIRYL
jgi:cupin superfamily acireductone dioxygenase involved in methionine salvage